MIAADNQQLLAGRGVPPWRIVVHAAIAHVHAIDDGIAKRPAALDDPPTHEGVYIVIRRSGANRTAQVVRVNHCERLEGLGRLQRRHEASSSSKTLACLRSSVSNPSVNHP